MWEYPISIQIEHMANMTEKKEVDADSTEDVCVHIMCAMCMDVYACSVCYNACMYSTYMYVLYVTCMCVFAL